EGAPVLRRRVIVFVGDSDIDAGRVVVTNEGVIGVGDSRQTAERVVLELGSCPVTPREWIALEYFPAFRVKVDRGLYADHVRRADLPAEAVERNRRLRSLRAAGHLNRGSIRGVIDDRGMSLGGCSGAHASEAIVAKTRLEATPGHRSDGPVGIDLPADGNGGRGYRSGRILQRAPFVAIGDLVSMCVSGALPIPLVVATIVGVNAEDGFTFEKTGFAVEVVMAVECLLGGGDCFVLDPLADEGREIVLVVDVGLTDEFPLLRHLSRLAEILQFVIGPVGECRLVDMSRAVRVVTLDIVSTEQRHVVFDFRSYRDSRLRLIRPGFILERPRS